MQNNNGPWLSVPQFGDWDMKGEVPDYSLDFSKIREMRKQNKRDLSRASIGNEEEISAANGAKSKSATVHGDQHDQYQQGHHHNHSPTDHVPFLIISNLIISRERRRISLGSDEDQVQLVVDSSVLQSKPLDWPEGASSAVSTVVQRHERSKEDGAIRVSQSSPWDHMVGLLTGME
ncbi:hypothetical protein SAY87_024012 [Trapa incisa]|uniref:RIN4 pathogenic type III effector avirulence factor Avr cleavage site domain-containing protein n=1 Tax=Trapa incisa TaxID=236973 RepID=A0AAN7KZK4_9MYRT|nr:hypothetical protein SAY87_024012 [Trapa incisa]